MNAYSYTVKKDFYKQNINTMCKLLNREIDLGESTSCLDHVYLGCTQKQFEMSIDIVEN